MNDYSLIDNNKEKTLSAIFQTDEDKNGVDILRMSNFFDIFIDDIDNKLDSSYSWERITNISSLLGKISTALKIGFEVSDMGVLIADSSHFSKKIVDGLKSGLYHIGQSKEVSGHLRPGVFDGKERLVKSFTLKKYLNPKDVLGDMSSLSMQMSLHQISAQLQGISQQIQYAVEFARRQSLSAPFINARQYIIKANNNPEYQIEFLHKADEYLTQGLTSLYTDVNGEVTRLVTANLKPNKNFIAELFDGNIKYVDCILSHINDDMLMIPKYVAVQIYLYQYMGRIDDAKKSIQDYKFYLNKLNTEVFPNSRYTAVQLIHDVYPYGNDNRDFGLEIPKETVIALDSLELFFEQKNKDIYYIESV